MQVPSKLTLCNVADMKIIKINFQFSSSTITNLQQNEKLIGKLQEERTICCHKPILQSIDITTSFHTDPKHNTSNLNMGMNTTIFFW